MALSNEGIRLAYAFRHIDIEPYNEEQLGPSSYDLTLGEWVIERFAEKPSTSPIFRVPLREPRIVDPYSKEETESAFSEPRRIHSDGYVLLAGKFILVSTREIVTLDARYEAQVVGKSSIARHGLEIESAGYVDPGFSGSITLELQLKAGGLLLYPGMPICQLKFTKLDTPSTAPYRGKYGGTSMPQVPRYYLNKRPS